MLIYHPTFDSYHCFLRILSLLSSIKMIEIDRLRIFDYYLSTPSTMKSFIFPKDLAKYKKTIAEKTNSYNDISNQKNLFFDLKGIQDAVFNKLISTNLINEESFIAGNVTLNDEEISSELRSIIQSRKSIDSEIMDFLLTQLIEIPLLGSNGLKYRSGLMDHRYDLL